MVHGCVSLLAGALYDVYLRDVPSLPLSRKTECSHELSD